MNLRYEPSVVSSVGFVKIMVDVCDPQNYTKDKFVFYAPLDSIWWPSTNNNQVTTRNATACFPLLSLIA